MDTAPATAGRLEIVSDAICPWCWIGKSHLDGALDLLRQDGIVFDIGWLPYQLNPEMPAAGVDRRTYRTEKFGSWERSVELDEQVADAGRVAGVTFRHDLMARTPNTIEAHRLIRLAGESGVQHEVMERVFRAYFHEGRDIGDQAVLAQAGAEGGMPEEALSAFTAGEAARAEVSAGIARPGAGRDFRRAVLPAGPAPAVLGRDAGAAHGGFLPPGARYPAQPRRLTRAGDGVQAPPAQSANSAAAQASTRKPVKSRMARRVMRPPGPAGVKRTTTGQGGMTRDGSKDRCVLMR